MANSSCKISLSDEELTKLAIETVLKETEQAAMRVEHVGPSGWQPRKKNINKNFLSNTLLANAQFNKRKERH